MAFDLVLVAYSIFLLVWQVRATITRKEEHPGFSYGEGMGAYAEETLWSFLIWIVLVALGPK